MLFYKDEVRYSLDNIDYVSKNKILSSNLFYNNDNAFTVPLNIIWYLKYKNVSEFIVKRLGELYVQQGGLHKNQEYPISTTTSFSSNLDGVLKIVVPKLRIIDSPGQILEFNINTDYFVFSFSMRIRYLDSPYFFVTKIISYNNINSISDIYTYFDASDNMIIYVKKNSKYLTLLTGGSTWLDNASVSVKFKKITDISVANVISNNNELYLYKSFVGITEQNIAISSVNVSDMNGLSTTNILNFYGNNVREYNSYRDGITSVRPTLYRYVGLQYFDTTLGYPIWWDGSVWKNSTGVTV